MLEYESLYLKGTFAVLSFNGSELRGIDIIGFDIFKLFFSCFLYPYECSLFLHILDNFNFL